METSAKANINVENVSPKALCDVSLIGLLMLMEHNIFVH